MQLRVVVAMVCLCSAITAQAQSHPPPKYPRPPGPVAPAMTDADRAWREAEAAPPGDAPARWRAAASAFDAVASDTRVAAAVRTEAAWTAVLAWKNALAVDVRVKAPVDEPEEAAGPAPLSLEDAGLVASLSRFLTLAPASADAPGVRFVRANVLRRYHHDDEALADLRELIAKHLDHEVGPYAVNLALDLLNRARRYDEMIALVASVRDDPRLVDAELIQRLRLLQRQSLRLQAERAATDAERTDDAAGYARCATFYEQASAIDPRGADRDELAYNAGVCWEHAIELDRARAAMAMVVAQKPPSRLAASARRIRARLAQLQGDWAAAATDLEAAARLDGGAVAVDDMLEVSRWRLALGDHAAVAKAAAWLAVSHKPVLAAQVLIASARMRLDAGDRRGARAALRRARTASGVDRETVEAALAALEAPTTKAAPAANAEHHGGFAGAPLELGLEAALATPPALAALP